MCCKNLISDGLMLVLMQFMKLLGPVRTQFGVGEGGMLILTL